MNNKDPAPNSPHDLDANDSMATTKIEIRRTPTQKLPHAFGHERLDGNNQNRNKTDLTPKLPHEFGHERFEGNRQDRNKTDTIAKLPT